MQFPLWKEFQLFFCIYSKAVQICFFMMLFFFWENLRCGNVILRQKVVYVGDWFSVLSWMLEIVLQNEQKMLISLIHLDFRVKIVFFTFCFSIQPDFFLYQHSFFV